MYDVVIGVKSPREAFAAHAWLERPGALTRPSSEDDTRSRHVRRLAAGLPRRAAPDDLRIGAATASAGLVGEVVVLDMQHSQYYGLNRQRAPPWPALRDRATLTQLRDMLVASHGISRGRRGRADAAEFVAALRSRDLLDEPAS